MEDKEKDKGFSYTYSARQQQEIKYIRQKYEPQQENKMEQLRRLDRSAENPPMIIALATGILGALILGGGMSAVLVGTAFWFIPGIIIGVVGLAIAGITYPLYLRMVKKYRDKAAPEILKILDEMKDGQKQ